MKWVSIALVAGAAGAQGTPRVDFAHDVLPILARSCFRCHRAPFRDERGMLRRPKAGLRLDGRGWILRGSDDHEVIVPGNPAKSLLYQLTTLPADHDDVMPAKGDPLTGEQTATLRRWIAAGADFGEWVGAPGPGGEAARSNAMPARIAMLARLAGGVAAAAPAAIREARGELARVEPVQPNSPLLRVEFLTAKDRVGHEEVVHLGPIAGQITHLDLARTNVTDGALASVARMSNLTHLDLRGTAVTDDGLDHLRRLQQLRTLNLFATRVTDAGLAGLSELARLQHVFLGRTRVTADGIARLRRGLPGCRVVHDPKLPDPPAEGADRGQRRRRRR